MQEESRIFKSEDYLEQYYQAVEGNQEEEMGNLQEEWACEAFNIIPESQTCLELGCGPSLNLAACASRKCKMLFISEFNTDCFRVLNHELTKDTAKEKSFWSERFKVIAKIEGSTAEEVESRLKERVYVGFKCDVSQDNILVGIEYMNKVDVITCSLVMESVSRSDDDYKRIIRNIKQLLKPNGYIYFFGVIGSTFYTVKDQRLPAHPLHEDLIKNTLEENGFEILKFNLQRNSNTTQVTVDNQGSYSVLAKRIN